MSQNNLPNSNKQDELSKFFYSIADDLKTNGDAFDKGWDAAIRYMTLFHPTTCLPHPHEVIFNDPATIVYWDDGTKTVVKCQSGDIFSAETGLMAAMLKRFMGNNNTYNKVINTWIPKD